MSRRNIQRLILEDKLRLPACYFTVTFTALRAPLAAYA